MPIKPCKKCNELLTLETREDNICPMCKALENTNMYRNLCQECQEYFTCHHEDREYRCPACIAMLVHHKLSKEKQTTMNQLDKQYIDNHPSNPAVEAPKSEVLAPGVDQVPFEGIEAIGAIFAEGEIKYGRGNWKKQPNNEEYNRERCRHAIRHLMLWANGDRSENHIAKVAWFCVTTIWREKNASS